MRSMWNFTICFTGLYCACMCVCKEDMNKSFSLLQKLTPWVGLRKINVSYWGWEDMSPFTAQHAAVVTRGAKWLRLLCVPGKSWGSRTQSQTLHCQHRGLICEKPVGEKSFFFHLSFVTWTWRWFSACSVVDDVLHLNPNWIRSHRKLHRVVKKWEVWHSNSSTHPLNLIKYIWY